MSNLSNILGGLGTPNYSLEQIVQAAQPQPQPSGFRRVLGGLVGGVGNMLMPGIGGLIGNAISGTSGINQTGLLGDSMKFLQLQQQMSVEQEAFQAVSAVVKTRHDSAMDAIRNIN
jgi:predicted lipid-binding transport protein (Tim44 family)